MNIKELIDELRQYSDDDEVVLGDGGTYGEQEIKLVKKPGKIRFDVSNLTEEAYLDGWRDKEASEG